MSDNEFNDLDDFFDIDSSDEFESVFDTPDSPINTPINAPINDKKEGIAPLIALENKEIDKKEGIDKEKAKNEENLKKSDENYKMNENVKNDKQEKTKKPKKKRSEMKSYWYKKKTKKQKTGPKLKRIEGPLNNIKWEKFAQSVVRNNGNVKDVLQECGYSTKNCSYYNQLRNKPEIANRINQIIEDTSKTGKIALLTERLEILSDIARDKDISRNIRIKALAEIHRQCGDNVTKVDINNNTVIKYVEIELPKKVNQLEESEIKEINGTSSISSISGNELDGLDIFLNNIIDAEITKEN